MGQTIQTPVQADVLRVTAGQISMGALARAARFAGWLLLLGIGYALTARLSHVSLFQRSPISLVWIPNALLVAALILTPRRSWWAVLVTSAIAHLSYMDASTPLWRMAWQIPANSLAAIAGVEALRRSIGFPLRFDSRREIFGFLGVAFAMPVLLACMAPAFVLSFAGIETQFTPFVAFVRIAAANITPVLFVTTVVVLCAQFDTARLKSTSRGRAIETALIMGSVLVTSIVSLNAGYNLSRLPWIVLLTFPPLIWAAVRLGPTGASVSLLCVAGFSISGALRQLGPFGLTPNTEIALSLQAYWIVIWGPIMLLAVALREREAFEATLDDLRAQLAHVHRMATVAELSGALAHDLRQPMTSILANAQAGLRFLDGDPSNVQRIREVLEDVVQDDQHAAGVIDRLRTLLKGGSTRLEPLSLESAVRDALALTRSTIAGAQVNVQTDIADGLPLVLGDRVQLVQLLMNLVVNGCESMAQVHVADRPLRIRVSQPDSGYLAVAVEDCGVGLSSAPENRLFEPFFTTKDNGLGLGLSLGRSIADAHGGRLWAENNHGRRGATFHLVLPTAKDA